jgi:VIT1/CCC1 family predicted Fe2+/Mn2+ transporter
MGRFLFKKELVGTSFVIALIILAIIAHLTGWSEGANKILTKTLDFVVAILIVGTFLR